MLFRLGGAFLFIKFIKQATNYLIFFLFLSICVIDSNDS